MKSQEPQQYQIETSGHLSTMMMPIQRERAASFRKPRESMLDSVMDGEMRPRTCSMPTRNNIKKPNLLRSQFGLYLDTNTDTYPVRTFKINSRGQLVNRGESIRSRSTNSVLMPDGELLPLSPSSSSSVYVSRDSLGPSSSVSLNGATVCVPSLVMVLGVSGVGKTAITQQSMTSKYLGGFNTSLCELLPFSKVFKTPLINSK